MKSFTFKPVLIVCLVAALVPVVSFAEEPYDPTAGPLYQQILALDTAMFDSFNKCSDPAELKKHAAFFAKDVEFFHDLGGVTLGADAVMTQTKANVCGKFHRELDVETFRVFPIKGYGAMSMGRHRFCHTATTCEGVGEFTTIWKETDGVWQATKVLSYAHQSEARPAHAQ